MALDTPSLQELVSAISSQVSTVAKVPPEPMDCRSFPSSFTDREREFPENLEIEQAHVELVESTSDLFHLALSL